MSIADILQRDLLEAAVEMARLHARVLNPDVAVTSDDPQFVRDYKRQAYKRLIEVLDHLEGLIT